VSLSVDQVLSQSFLEKLHDLAVKNAQTYQNNKPFPSIYFDNFFPQDAVEAALRDFPQPQILPWKRFDDARQKKLAFDAVEKLPASIRNVLLFMNSRPMLEFLETLTGITGLISDPYYAGGGLHQIEPGGKLAVHVDFNRHPKLRLDRRLNVLLYLNKDWKEEYGGHFELWNRDMSAAEVKVLPAFNRCAIFSTSEHSYHGHPDPLACPPDRTRKSLATYYYTNGRPEEEIAPPHSTLWKQRPGEVIKSRPKLSVLRFARAFREAYRRLS
jgi:Rps23 Pro-64 3,4-dihydroxylase Tpa1-like proline 4-hydroxylase